MKRQNKSLKRISDTESLGMAILQLSPRKDTNEGLDFWRDVYGYVMGKSETLPETK